MRRLDMSHPIAVETCLRPGTPTPLPPLWGFDMGSTESLPTGFLDSLPLSLCLCDSSRNNTRFRRQPGLISTGKFVYPVGRDSVEPTSMSRRDIRERPGDSLPAEVSNVDGNRPDQRPDEYGAFRRSNDLVVAASGVVLFSAL